LISQNQWDSGHKKFDHSLGQVSQHFWNQVYGRLNNYIDATAPLVALISTALEFVHALQIATDLQAYACNRIT
jgi:hypothetical protein